MHPFARVLLFLTLLPAVVFAQDPPAAARLVHDLAGFSFTPPPEWTVESRGPLTVKFEGMRRNDVTPVLTVIRIDTPLPQPLAEFAVAARNTFKLQTEKFALQSEGPLTVGGLPARQNRFTAEVRGRTYAFGQVIVQTGTHTLFSIDSRTAARDWEAFAPVFEACVAGFRTEPFHLTPEEEKSLARTRAFLADAGLASLRASEQWLTILVKGKKQGYSRKRVIPEPLEGKPAVTHERDVNLFFRGGGSSRARSIYRFTDDLSIQTGEETELTIDGAGKRIENRYRSRLEGGRLTTTRELAGRSGDFALETGPSVIFAELLGDLQDRLMIREQANLPWVFQVADPKSNRVELDAVSFHPGERAPGPGGEEVPATRVSVVRNRSAEIRKWMGADGRILRWKGADESIEMRETTREEALKGMPEPPR